MATGQSSYSMEAVVEKAAQERSTAGLKIFHELASFLHDNSNRRFSFEILPSSTVSAREPGKSYLLVDDNAAAARKSDILKAYLIARLVLLEHAVTRNGFKGPVIELPTSLQAIEACSAARVALIYDPEHLTAANFLKRSLRDNPAADALQHEINFNESILTSPLHKHSKSPTLWSHRLWLMATFRPWEQAEVAYSATIPEDGVEVADHLSRHYLSELDIVLGAAEQHARNYYAFQYLRKLREVLFSPRTGESIGGSEAGVLPMSLKKLSRWCLKHPRDISGLTALAWMLQCASQHPGLDALVLQTADEIGRFRESLQWKGESVEFFLTISSKLTESMDKVREA